MEAKPSSKNGVIQILSNQLSGKNIKFILRNITYQLLYKVHKTIHYLSVYIPPDNS